MANGEPTNALVTTSAEATGLPLLHTWRAVYVFVVACFVLWVVLLFALSLSFA